MFKNLKIPEKIWQKIINSIEILIVFSFVLLALINLIIFFDKNFDSILGDPSRKIELSYNFFTPGFIILWALIFFILIYCLVKRFFIIQEKSAKNDNKIINLNQRILKKFEIFLIFISIIGVIIFCFYYFSRVYVLTSSIFFVIMSLLFAAFICFLTIFTKKNDI